MKGIIMLLDLNKFQISHRGSATLLLDCTLGLGGTRATSPFQMTRYLKTVTHFPNMCSLFSTFFQATSFRAEVRRHSLIKRSNVRTSNYDGGKRHFPPEMVFVD